MFSIESNQDCAFGNGTRKAGYPFASVQLKGENNLYQLLMELRKPGCKSVDDLETAEVTLNEGVTKREFTMVLNNAAVMKVVDASEIFDPEDFDKLNAKKAIEYVKSLDAEQRKLALEHEINKKNRKAVLEAFHDADPKLKTIESLEIADDTKLALLNAGIETIGQFEAHVDEHEGLKIDGLTDELTNELIAAIKLQLKEA